MPDPSRTRDARAIVARFAPEHATLPFTRTLSPRDRRARGLSARVLLSPERLGAAMAARMRGAGVRTRVLAASQAPVDDLAEQYLSRAARLGPGEALVRVAEPSVRVRGRGRGGRSTHLAAQVGGNLPDGFLFLALATDGVDGPSGTGGALVDGRFARHGASIAAALAAYDTGPLHRALGTALPRAPTGHNLADLHVLLRLR